MTSVLATVRTGKRHRQTDRHVGQNRSSKNVLEERKERRDFNAKDERKGRRRRFFSSSLVLNFGKRKESPWLHGWMDGWSWRGCFVVALVTRSPAPDYECLPDCPPKEILIPRGILFSWHRSKPISLFLPPPSNLAMWQSVVFILWVEKERIH